MGNEYPIITLMTQHIDKRKSYLHLHLILHPSPHIFHPSPLNNPLLEFVFHKFVYIYILMQTNSPPRYHDIMFSMVFLHASILLGKYQAWKSYLSIGKQTPRVNNYFSIGLISSFHFKVVSIFIWLEGLHRESLEMIECTIDLSGHSRIRKTQVQLAPLSPLGSCISQWIQCNEGLRHLLDLTHQKKKKKVCAEKLARSIFWIPILLWL